MSDSGAREATRVVLEGMVQGLGVRPAVARLAAELALVGRVRNDSSGVVIELEGNAERLQQFVNELPNRLPRGASVERCNRQSLDVVGYVSFEIELGKVAEIIQARIPLDRMVCDACLGEVLNPRDRRFRFAFNSCLDCGPRYSIIGQMPYERAATSMADFAMCDECRQEYEQPASRRFHAQTIACPQCGPRLWFVENENGCVSEAASVDPIAAAAERIRRGGIIAVKGIGGYQLVCDASNEAVVSRLRRLKRRPGKPLAVMVSGWAQAQQIAYWDAAERAALSSPAGPIVLVRQRPDHGLATSINPGLVDLGLLLPTTPLHQLLLEEVGKPLVMTSGNVAGEPLAYRIDQAEQCLGPIADGFLHHDREIEHPIDDSVVRLIAGRRVTLRAGRGLAPLGLNLPSPQAAIAVGGYQKVAVATSNGRQSILWPHIGDLGTVASRQRFVERIEASVRLVGCSLNTSSFHAVADAHPDYFSGHWAEQRFGRVTRVQHHHSHVVAGMVEAGWTDREVLGFAFDGTGWGTDGTIWGGEVLRATVREAERVGSLRPITLLGGEAAVRAPWRIGLAMLEETFGEETDSILRQLMWDDAASKPLRRLLEHSRSLPRASSIGRLFDGVAAIALGIRESQFEGQAAMRLEAACPLAEFQQSGDRQTITPSGYEIAIVPGQPAVFDWRPLVRQLVRDRLTGATAGVMATRFHHGLADLVARFARRWPELPIVLSGGVFQNRPLTERIVQRLSDHPAPIGLPGTIPPGDGGLAVGQLAIGADGGPINKRGVSLTKRACRSGHGKSRANRLGGDC